MARPAMTTPVKRPLAPRLSRWTTWLSLPVLAFTVAVEWPGALPPEGLIPGKLLGIALGAWLVAVVILWIHGLGAAGRGLHRAGFLGALGGSVAMVFQWWSGFLAGLTTGVAEPRPPGSGWADLAVTVTLILVVALLLDRVARHREAAERRAALLRDAQDAALRTRLAPHFVFNALATVKAQLAAEPAAAAATVDRLAGLLRQVLLAADRPTVPLREELAFVESYLGIERARLGGRLQVAVDVPDALEEVEVPPLSLQALVENAVKHGVASRVEGGAIRIDARAEPGAVPPALVVGVSSPLPARAEGGEADGTATGLAALRGRLARPGDLTLETAGGVVRAEFRWALS